MKKRNHSYSLNDQVSSLNLKGRLSGRNLYSNDRTNHRFLSAARDWQASPIHEARLVWTKEDTAPAIVEDDLASSELKTFTFSCIEKLSNLANLGSAKNIGQILLDLISEKLPQFDTLINERNVARFEYLENKSWGDKFIKNVRPLISDQSNPSLEVTAIINQAVMCVEKTMLSKYALQTLNSRIDTITKTVSAFIIETGSELQLPAPVMKKMATHVSKALAKIAK